MTSFALQSLFVSGSRFFEKIISFVIIIFLSRILGSENIGEFFYYFSLMSLFIPIMDMGFEKLLMQKWQTSKEEREILFGKLLHLKLFVGVVALTLGIATDVVVRWGGANPIAVLAAFIALYAEEFGDLFRTPARAENNPVFEVIVPSLTKTIICLVVIFYGRSIGSGWHVLYIYAIANSIGALISLWGAGKLNPWRFQFAAFSDYLDLVKQGIPFSIISFCVLLSLFVDSVMLGHFSFQEVGFYNAAYRIILVIAGWSQGVCYGLFPRVVELQRRGNLNDASLLVHQILSIFLILFGTIAIGGMVTGPILIHTVYGSAFSNAAVPFQILSAIILLSPLSDIFGHVLEALGHQQSATRCYLAGSSFNFFSNFLFIPFFGMYGAACTTVGTAILVLGGLIHRMNKVEGVDWLPHKLLRSLLFLACISVLYTPLAWIDHLFAVPLGGLIAGILFFPFHQFWLPHASLKAFLSWRV